MRAPRIRGLRRRRDVGGLVEALGYVNPISLGGGRHADYGVAVRLRALEALAEVAAPTDVEKVVVGLRDPDPTVRRVSVRVVRKLDAERGADALAAALVGPAAAEFAEARLEARAALEELAGRDVKGTARRIALATVDGGPQVALDGVTRGALERSVAAAPPGEAADLVRDLVDRLPAMNGSLDRAQVVLSWLAPHSVDPLIEALDREGGPREPAAAVLGAIRDSRALEPLAGVLDDRRAAVRRTAVWALGELRDPRAVEALMRATMDAEYVVRRQAGEALDSMGSIALMAGVANMIRSLESRPDGPTVARLVEEGLERAPAAGSRAEERAGWAPSFVGCLQADPRRR